MIARDRRVPLREELRAVARGGAAGRSAADLDRRGDRCGQVHHRHAARRATGHHPGGRDRRRARGDAGDAVAGARAHAARVVFPGGQALREPPTRSADALVLGFREQTAAVSVGVNALIERAALEGTSIVIEGAHIVPGFFDVETHGGAPARGTLRGRGRRRRAAPFALRGPRGRRRIPPRPAVRGRVRQHPQAAALGEDQALSHGVPVIPNYSFDQSIAAVIDLVMERATTRAAELRAGGVPGSAGRSFGPDRPESQRETRRKG